MLAINRTTTFETQLCCTCGVEFAASSEFFNARRRNHSLNFYCPNGHNQVFTGETEAQKYKRLYEAEQAAKARAQEESQRKDRQLIAAKAQVTKARKRATAGVCPVVGCRRHFTNLERHIGTKHPGYEKQDIG